MGVYYSSSSQLLELLPGGFRNHADQTHSFAFWGWGTALGQLHVQWRAVPEWKLNADTLRGLCTLIVPCAEVLDADEPVSLFGARQVHAVESDDATRHHHPEQLPHHEVHAREELLIGAHVAHVGNRIGV